MMLPTVHQADSYRYARLGAVLGERAAAFAASQLAADLAVAHRRRRRLRRTRGRRARRTPRSLAARAPPTGRGRRFREQSAGNGAPLLGGRAPRRGRGWAAAADGLALRSAALLLPSSARGGAMSDSVARELWASDESAEGLVVLLPLGAAAARRGVEVLLPEGRDPRAARARPRGGRRAASRRARALALCGRRRAGGRRGGRRPPARPGPCSRTRRQLSPTSPRRATRRTPRGWACARSTR